MYLQFETKEDFLKWAQENILTPQEVTALLDCSLQAVGQSVRNGKLSALKKHERTTLFLREDVQRRASELQTLRRKYRPYDPQSFTGGMIGDKPLTAGMLIRVKELGARDLQLTQHFGENLYEARLLEDPYSPYVIRVWMTDTPPFEYEFRLDDTDPNQ